MWRRDWSHNFFERCPAVCRWTEELPRRVPLNGRAAPSCPAVFGSQKEWDTFWEHYHFTKLNSNLPTNINHNRSWRFLGMQFLWNSPWFCNFPALPRRILLLFYGRTTTINLINNWIRKQTIAAGAGGGRKGATIMTIPSMERMMLCFYLCY